MKSKGRKGAVLIKNSIFSSRDFGNNFVNTKGILVKKEKNASSLKRCL
jgi:hypothetical protein